MEVVQYFVAGTIVRYKMSPYIVNGEKNSSTMILNRVFWSFKPCIESFSYCKPIVQVDDTFLTGKYPDTLLIVITQDRDQNMFPLAFAIVEGETKEAWMWFLHYLRTYVTPQPNLCNISYRWRALLAALQSEQLGWIGSSVNSIFCIRHIASNFNKEFKNSELKSEVFNMGKFQINYLLGNYIISPL